MTKVKLNWWAQLLAVLAVSLALKFHYSTANVNQLRWILAPTTWLVELITGTQFTFESLAGYMSADHTFLIAGSCAGVNFLLTAFLTLALSKLWRNRLRDISWSFLPLSAGLAYVATLVANTTRISTALQLRSLPAGTAWLNAEQLHRFEGVFIYFGFLLLLFWVTERLGRRNEETHFWSWQLVVPLFIYYATTLGIPVMNGAIWQGSEFWEHALFVISIPLIFLTPMLGWRLMHQLFPGRAVKSVPIPLLRQ